jgi:large subunit ribosomal protein L9
MKVLLLKDVYNLGRAGDVKKVADGYGRNFLVPQGLATLATPGAMKQAEHIRTVAGAERSRLNEELGSVAEKIEGLQLIFPVKAGETGRLYGSVTTMMIADAIQNASDVEIDRRQIDSQPIKIIGVHSARVRLTIDLVPEISIIVHPEDESPESVLEEDIVVDDVPTEAFSDLQAELDAEEKAAEEAEIAAAELEAMESEEILEEESDTPDEEISEAIEVVQESAEEQGELGEEELSTLPDESSSEA